MSLVPCVVLLAPQVPGTPEAGGFLIVSFLAGSDPGGVPIGPGPPGLALTSGGLKST